MPVDPMFPNPLDAVLVSSTALLYVNLIVAGILLLEALLFSALALRRRVSRESVLMWLALTALALALAYYMWSVYAQGSRAPHFPPEWQESWGGVLPPYMLLTLALAALAACTAPPLVLAVIITYGAAIFMSHKKPS